MAGHVNGQGTFLVTDSSVGTDSLDMERIFSAGQITEGHAMGEGISVFPVIVETFHPVHELQTLTLVVVTCSKLDGKRVLVVVQFQFRGLIEGLRQKNITIVFMSCEHFFLSQEQLGEHHPGQSIGL